MYKVLLCGNPNTGKTTIFNMLTGKKLKTGNWHGVTVESTSAKCRKTFSSVELTDVPGLYTLNVYSMEELAASREITSGGYDFALNVCDAANLERCLKLTGELVSRGIKTAVIVNMYDSFIKNGGSFDYKLFEKQTKIPVFLLGKISRKNARELSKFIDDILSKKTQLKPDKKIAVSAGKYKSPEPKLTFFDKVFLNKYIALPLFFGIISFVFYITFGKNMPGDKLKTLTENFININIKSFFSKLIILSGAPAFINGLVCDAVIGGAGVLIAFIPQLSILFLCLIIMEESGYISRLAFMTDGIFSKAGLSGKAVFSMLMGFGCTAAAVGTTRALENKNLQRRTVFSLPYIPCSAKLPVISMLASAFFESPFIIIFAVYITGTLLSFISARLLLKKLPDTEPFITELAPLRIPDFKRTLSSLIYQVRQFIIKIGGAVLSFVVIMWFMSSFDFKLNYLSPVEIEKSIIAYAGSFLKYMFYPIGIRGWQMPVAMLSGLIAKETVAGVLLLLYPGGLAGVISPVSALSLIVFTATYTTCISTVVASAKETDVKTAVKLAAFQLFSALLFSYLTYFLCMLILIYGFARIAWTTACITSLIIAVSRLTKGKCRGCGKGGCNAKIYGCPKKHS